MFMKRLFVTAVAMAIVLTAGQALFAQKATADAEYDKYVALLRKDIRSDKKQFLALNLPLTEAESVKFWPVYEQYAAELAKVYDARIQIVKDYAASFSTLSDATAASLNLRAIDNEEAVTKLRQKYVPLVGRVLPGKKAALFFQIEKRLGLLIDLQLASEIPLVIQ
jgi:hypothetical protein